MGVFRQVAAALGAAGVLSLGCMAHADEPGAEAIAALKARIHTGVEACRVAADALPAADGTTVEDVVRAYDRITGVGQGCRWQGQVGDPKMRTQLVEATEAELVELSTTKCGGPTPDEICRAAARLLVRVRGMLAAIREGSDIPSADAFTFYSLSKISGTGEDAVDPMRIALEPDVGLTAPQWIARQPERMSYLLDALNADRTKACKPCMERLKRVLVLVPIFDVLDISLGARDAAIWAVIAKDAKRNAERWDAYHFGGGSTRTQLPWELAVNGFIYQSITAPERRAGVVSGTPSGPPEFAAVFLHPSIGVTPFNTKGADSNVIGVVEAVGFTKWTYDSKTNKRKDEWGFSLAGVYQPRDDGDDWAPGVLVRLPFQGINVVYSRPELDSGKNDDVWALSVDVNKLFGEGKRGGLACTFGLPGCKK